MTAAPVQSFFTIFGTTGCQLNCARVGQIHAENKTNDNVHTIVERKRLRLSRKSQQALILAGREWFTADEIQASVASGCGSCHALRQIFQNSFPGEQQVLSDEYQYSLSWDFELR